MRVEMEMWQLILALIAFIGFCGGAGKIFLNQFNKGLDTRFESQDTARKTFHEALQSRLAGIESTAREEAAEWKRVERELQEMKADLPLHYVRREDYIRGQSVIESKLDALYNKLENVQLRAIINEKGARNVT